MHPRTTSWCLSQELSQIWLLWTTMNMLSKWASQLHQADKLEATNIWLMITLTAANLEETLVLMVSLKLSIDQSAEKLTKQESEEEIVMLRDMESHSLSANSVLAWTLKLAPSRSLKLETFLMNIWTDGLTGNSSLSKIWLLQLETRVKVFTIKTELSKFQKLNN